MMRKNLVSDVISFCPSYCIFASVVLVNDCTVHRSVYYSRTNFDKEDADGARIYWCKITVNGCPVFLLEQFNRPCCENASCNIHRSKSSPSTGDVCRRVTRCWPCDSYDSSAKTDQIVEQYAFICVKVSECGVKVCVGVGSTVM